MKMWFPPNKARLGPFHFQKQNQNQTKWIRLTTSLGGGYRRTRKTRWTTWGKVSTVYMKRIGSGRKPGTRKGRVPSRKVGA